MVRVLAATLTLLLISLEPAHADWEWTRWGMTPVQAMSASQGKALSATSDEKKRRTYRKGFVPIRVPQLVADHHVQGAELVAYLLFDIDSAKLVCVDLLPKAGNTLPGDLKASLTKAYGKPAGEEEKELPGLHWTTTTWIAGSDRIELQQGGLGSKLQYCQRGS